jgi:hypothetical protein
MLVVREVEEMRSLGLRKRWWRRARRGSVVVQRMRGVEVPREVYVLVRVFDVEVGGGREESVKGGKGKEREEREKMVFLVDPWEAFCEERLVLRAKGGIVGALA